MNRYVEERAVEIANFVISTNATVREAARKFHISKSTVHKDITERLTTVNPDLAGKAQSVWAKNKEERNIRAGEATKEGYRNGTIKRGYRQKTK